MQRPRRSQTLRTPSNFEHTSKQRESHILEILKVVAIVILLLLGLAILAMIFLLLILMGLGLPLGDALEFVGFLINPFSIFELFGWIGVGVWLVVWFVIAVLFFLWIRGRS